MKTKFILFVCMSIGSLNFLHARETSNDSVGNSLQAKIKELEIHVKNLQAEIRSLKSTDSLHQSELLSLKKSLRIAPTRKLIINRTGSKQASMQ
jgi:predicted RNase H-like nuclease (RuvC/YqgF family)